MELPEIICLSMSAPPASYFNRKSMKLRSQAVVVICCCFYRVSSHHLRRLPIYLPHILCHLRHINIMIRGASGGPYGLYRQTHSTLMESNLWRKIMSVVICESLPAPADGRGIESSTPTFVCLCLTFRPSVASSFIYSLPLSHTLTPLEKRSCWGR